ncbi:hypothetical protein ABZS76_00065 [Streptomyces sp. NPDC005562]|uniref:hypothetical protein n=1 Tax=Streptomyces sp. NPDC005562 TaxID=3154890 RepID=UPI00339F377B
MQGLETVLVRLASTVLTALTKVYVSKVPEVGGIAALAELPQLAEVTFGKSRPGRRRLTPAPR